MTHYPYDEWVFLDSKSREQTLSDQDLDNLQAHLHICDSCRVKSTSWNSIEQELSQSEMLAPTAGFTQRWEQRLESEKVRNQKRQTLSIVVFSSGLAIAILVILIIMAFPWLKSPNILFWTMVYRVFQAYVLLDVARTTVSSFLGVFGNLAPFFIVAPVTVLISLLGVIWFVSNKFVLNPRRIIS